MVKKLLLILLLILLPFSAFGATYYIDPTCTTSGTGTSQTCDAADGPFKTWAEVTWTAGNTYSQKGGTTTTETITVGATGTEGNIITINSYGTGYAYLNTFKTIPSDQWTDLEDGTYQSTYHPSGMGVGQIGYAVEEDGIYMKTASKSATCTILEAFACTGTGTPTACCGSTDNTGSKNLYTANVNYYKPSSGTPSDHIIKRPNTYGIEVGLYDYITITGFDITGATYGIHGSTTTHSEGNNYITVTNNNFHNMFSGVWLETLDADSYGINISNNTFDYIRMSVELQINGDCHRSAGGGTGDFTNVTLANNTITNGNLIADNGINYTWESVNLLDWDEEGLGVQSLSSSNIYGNNISGYIRGIVFFVCEGTNGINNNIYQNYIHTTRTPIMLQPSKGLATEPVAFSNNKIYYNVLIGGGYANGVINITSKTTPDTTYNYIYNNTIMGNGVSLYFLADSDYYNVRNNILLSSGSNAFVMLNTSQPEHMVIDYNLYFHGTGVWYAEWDTPHSNDFTAWRAFGYDTHPAGGTGNDDPLFARSSIIGTSGNWTDEGSNVWSKSMASFPISIIFDSTTVGLIRSSLATVNAKNYYTYLPPKIYVYATSNPATYYTAIEEITSLPLVVSSPAINAGVDVSLTTDYLGNPIVGLPDIGAYEYGTVAQSGGSAGSGFKLQGVTIR